MASGARATTVRRPEEVEHHRFGAVALSTLVAVVVGDCSTTTAPMATISK